MSQLPQQLAATAEDTPPSSPPPVSSSPLPSDDDDSFEFFDKDDDPDAGKELLSSHLERIHVTEGLRAGIAESKGVNVQAGFDEGYMLGAVLGLKCGEILGVLGGVVGALQQAAGGVPPTTTATTASYKKASIGRNEKGISDRNPIIIEQDEDFTNTAAAVEKENEPTLSEPAELITWRKLQSQAKEELRLEVVCGRAYFGEDGLWKWDTADDDDEEGEERTWETTAATTTKSDGDDGDVTFYDVAAAHPLIVKWAKIVSDEALKVGVDVGSLNEMSRS